MEEELEALEAILGSGVEVQEDRRGCRLELEVRLEEGRGARLLLEGEEVVLDIQHLPPVTLKLKMPETYPETDPPQVLYYAQLPVYNQVLKHTLK